MPKCQIIAQKNQQNWSEQKAATTKLITTDNVDNELAYPDYIEAEIDSTDQLIPTMTEQFGQALLSQRYVDDEFKPLIAPPTCSSSSILAAEADDESLPNIVPGTAPPLRTRRMMMGPAGIRPHISNNKSSWPIAPAPVRSRTVLSPSSLRPARRSPGPSRSSSVVASSSSSNSSRGGHLKSPLQQQTTTIKQAAAVGSSIAEENDENVLFTPSTSSYPLTMATVKKCVHFEQSPTRTSSMMSHMTFVVDNNSRRPLLVATGLSKILGGVVLEKESPLLARNRTTINKTTTTTTPSPLQRSQSSSRPETSSSSILSSKETAEAPNQSQLAALPKIQNQQQASAKSSSSVSLLKSSQTNHRVNSQRQQQQNITNNMKSTTGGNKDRGDHEEAKQRENGPSVGIKEKMAETDEKMSSERRTHPIDSFDYEKAFVSRPKVTRTPPPQTTAEEVAD